MFARTVQVEHVRGDGTASFCPVRWLDNFAMRNFTNDAIFDDTLPIADGFLEIGNRIQVSRLQAAMDEWFRRKSYLKAGEFLRLQELPAD